MSLTYVDEVTRRARAAPRLAGDAKKAAAGVEAPRAGWRATGALEERRARLGRLRRSLVLAVPAAAMAIAVALVVAGLPEYGRHVAFEQNAMTWLQSVILVVSGVVAGLVAARCWLAGRRTWPWIMLALGFLVLAVDESFLVHEQVREGMLAGLPRALPWAAPGEVLPLVYVVAGLAMARVVLRALGEDPAARRAFLVGLVAAVATIGADTVDAQSFSYSGLLAFQTVEEIVELLAQSTMLLGLVLFALGRPPSPDRKGPAVSRGAGTMGAANGRRVGVTLGAIDGRRAGGLRGAGRGAA